MVVGASGFGRPIADVCHCPEFFATLAGCQGFDLVTPGRLSTVLQKEALGQLVLVNQCTPEHVEFARELEKMIKIPLFYGEIQKNNIERGALCNISSPF